MMPIQAMADEHDDGDHETLVLVLLIHRRVARVVHCYDY
jgi:hypothetical protein